MAGNMWLFLRGAESRAALPVAASWLLPCRSLLDERRRSPDIDRSRGVTVERRDGPIELMHHLVTGAIGFELE